MKIVKRIESREPCAEAGWYAYDYLFDEQMKPAFIRKLRPLGDFVYLSMLKRPFFKVESDNFIIKGIEGDEFLRVAIHESNTEALEEIEKFLRED